MCVCCRFDQSQISVFVPLSKYIQKKMTALMCATARNHADCVRLLLEAGANKISKDEDGRTALFWAARNGRAECLRLLLNAGADKEATDNVRYRSAVSLLMPFVLDICSY